MAIKIGYKTVTKLSQIVLGCLLILSLQPVGAGNVGWFYALEQDRSAFEKVAGPPIRTINLLGGTVAYETAMGLRHARLVSGEVFVASAEKRIELAKEFGADLVEMNALGLLAAVEGTRAEVMVLRVVSDFADEQASEDFAAFLSAYKGEGGTMVAELVKALPVGKDEPTAHGELKKLLED